MLIAVVGDLIGFADDVIAPTYNSVTATLVDHSTTGDANNRFAYLYILTSPNTGSNTLQVTSTTNHFLLAGCVTYSGTDTTTQPDAHAVTDSGADVTTYTSSLTSVVDNCWMVLMSSQQQTPSAGAGSTLRGAPGAFGTWAFYDSNGVISPPASYSMNTTQALALSYIIHLMASIKPAASADVLLGGICL